MTRRSEVRAAKFSPDGSMVLTGAGDGTAAIWSSNGQRLTTLDRGTAGASGWCVGATRAVGSQQLVKSGV
eukprot:Skav226206  [mRNA]  locus=scaffold2208:485726:488643:- [translate_table: standard]